MAYTWVCYHIYYHHNQNSLLKYCIFPAMQLLEDQALSSGFFFLRYWKNGPHIRLRIQTHKNNIKDLCAYLEQHIACYLLNNPCPITLANDKYTETINKFVKFEGEWQILETMLPNNYFRLEPYCPEYNKYGGKQGVQIAESVFITSSKLIANLLNHNSGIAINRLNRSFVMMCIGLKAFNFTKQQALEFFDNYFSYWSQYINFQNKQSIYNAWQQCLNNLSAHLINTIEEIFSNKLTYEGYIKQWYKRLAITRKIIDRFNYNIFDKIKYKNSLLYFNYQHHLLFNYLHTHNNRYGITPIEEALLGFIGKSILTTHLEDCS